VTRIGKGAAPAEAAAGRPGASRMRAIAYMVCGVTVFAGLDASAKFAARELPVLEVAWFRYFFHFVIAVAVLNPISAPTAWRISRPVAQALRAAMLVGSTLSNFLALRYLQLDQTVSINFLTPLVIAGLSAVLLGERIGPRRAAAILVGFGGILMVTRPGLGGFHPAMLLSLFTVLCNSGYNMLTRSLARTESPGSMLLVVAGVPCVVLLPALVLVFETPDRLELWFFMVATGVTGAGGHFLLILAHRHASASVLAPFGYAQIVGTIAIGWAMFGDVPDRWTLAGAAVVVASGLYLFHRERVTGARLRDTATLPAE